MSAQLVHDVGGFAISIARLVIWLVLLTAIFVPLEALFALHRRPGRLKEIPADLVFYFLNSLAPVAIIAIPISLVASVVHRVTPETYVAAITGLPLWIKLVAGLVISEIGGYWGHRWSHETPVLWRFHAVHHAPGHIDWLVNTRAHPMDMVFTKLCALVPLYVLGLAQPTPAGSAVAIYVTLIGTVWAFFIHANMRWRFGPLEWLVATPAFHHWHHTNDENRDHNYAAMLPVIDRLFGTHHLPRGWPPVYGVDEPAPIGIASQLLHPLGFGPPARPLAPKAP